MVGQMNQMQMNMQGGGQIMQGGGPINNMNMPMTINSSLPNQNQINTSNLNQPMNAGQQLNPNQMTQMLNRINSVQGIVGQPNAPNAGNQMNQPQLVSN